MPTYKFPFLIFPLLFLSACNTATPAVPTKDGNLQVVATYSILGDWVQAVGGSAIDLQVMVGADSDAHTFEPTPADGVRLARADVIFENGIGFETWLDDLYTASQSSAERVVVSQELEILPVVEGGHDHSENDPHVWHSVPNAMVMVRQIQVTLERLDPANASTYAQNAETYLAELTKLDQWILAQVAEIPEAHRKLLTSHDTFSYFAYTYGFEILGSALGSVSTESGDASAAHIAQIAEEIRQSGVPAIFAENVHNPKLIEQIAQTAGVQLAPTLYTDALGAPGSAGETYLKFMQYNIETIRTALQ
ncbi:MAG TPA: zinc ABC transporter substrate-binding protein [Anaerolineales bacterium]|nr:zinc ABC transporter substrate-binding protein [Anaerolineales bacterium]